MTNRQWYVAILGGGLLGAAMLWLAASLPGEYTRGALLPRPRPASKPASAVFVAVSVPGPLGWWPDINAATPYTVSVNDGQSIACSFSFTGRTAVRNNPSDLGFCTSFVNTFSGPLTLTASTAQNFVTPLDDRNRGGWHCSANGFNIPFRQWDSWFSYTITIPQADMLWLLDKKGSLECSWNFGHQRSYSLNMPGATHEFSGAPERRVFEIPSTGTVAHPIEVILNEGSDIRGFFPGLVDPELVEVRLKDPALIPQNARISFSNTRPRQYNDFSEPTPTDSITLYVTSNNLTAGDYRLPLVVLVQRVGRRNEVVTFFASEDYVILRVPGVTPSPTPASTPSSDASPTAAPSGQPSPQPSPSPTPSPESSNQPTPTAEVRVIIE